MTSKQRTAAAKFDEIPGALPRGNIPEGTNLDIVAKDAIAKLNDLHQEDLTSDALWRDLLALTDTYRTFSTANVIYNTLQKLSDRRGRSLFHLGDHAPHVVSSVGCSWIDVDVWFSIRESDLVGQCAGTVSIVKDSADNWKIWMLRTCLERWDGHGDPDHPPSVQHYPIRNGMQSCSPKIYDVIIAGGGQCGLSVSGRFQALGIEYILFEALPSVGDIWANRYDSLKWHTTRDFGNLPFGHTFSVEDDQMLPIKRIAAGQNAWSAKYRINVQTSTTVESAEWDDMAQLWNVTTVHSDARSSWRAKNLILSMGMGSTHPVSPDWASEQSVKTSGYKGTILHSIHYHNAEPWAGQRGIVIGTANTAHDIAEDMANVGMNTTMVQRSPTFVFPVEWLLAAQGKYYNREKLTTVADREQVTIPHKIMREMVNRGVRAGYQSSPERFTALEKAGFRLDRDFDVLTNLMVRFGGHYVDIGASKRIADGEIKIKAVPVKKLTKNGVLFEDGSELEADLIVLATGFDHDFRKRAANLLGKEVSDQMDDYWGLTAEGELRGHARLAGHPHLYYFGGDPQLARFFSKLVALQVQKELLGKPLSPYLNVSDSVDGTQ